MTASLGAHPTTPLRDGEPAAQPATLLEIRDLTKQFGGVLAVDGVDLDVREGEILGLIGPNGAGKTTILNMLSGLIPPTRGEVVFQGRPILRLRADQRAKLGIGRTFQIVKPFEGMTVLENVAAGAMFGPEGLRLKQALAVARQVLDQVDLAGKASYLADELTVADRKRLELARALAMGPKLLLLDEVMAGLNLSEIERLMSLVVDINRRGVTIVVIEHVMKAVMGISHRVAVLHYGKLLAVGAPREIASDPRVIEAYLGKRYAQGDAPRPAAGGGVSR